MAGVVEGLALLERRLPPPECLAEVKDGRKLVMFCMCAAWTSAIGRRRAWADDDFQL